MQRNKGQGVRNIERVGAWDDDKNNARNCAVPIADLAPLLCFFRAVREAYEV